MKYPKIQTPLQGQWGTFNMWLGPQICEYGDCGGSSNEYDVADDSRVPLMGHLKVEIHGDLPPEVEPSIGIQQMVTASDPTAYPTLYLNQSTAVHPVQPGTHRVLTRKEVFKGNSYQPHLEQKSPQGWVGLPNQQVEIDIGRLTHIRVSYRRVAP